MKHSIGAKLIDTISGIFTPILSVLVAAGMLKAVLALLLAFNLITKDAQVYQIISFMADAGYFFLPIMLANSAAKKFNCNAYLAMMLGGILLHPDFISMVAASKETGEAIKLFFLPIYNASYSSSVIPIILSVWFMSKVEPIADRISPKPVKFFTRPLITILVTGVVTLVVFGPIGYIVANIIATALTTLDVVAGWLVPTVVGALLPMLVMTGTHYSLVSVSINSRMTIGYDTMYTGGSPGLMTMPGYIGGDGLHDLIFACLGALIAFVIAFIVSFILYRDPKQEATAEPVVEAVPVKTSAMEGTANVHAPLTGTAVELSQVNDPTFAEEILGKGVAIIPEEGLVSSPVNGTVQMIFETLHAASVSSDDGTEILIHVGLDTVKLNGKYYKALVKTGDRVKVGTPMIQFDIEKIKGEGYDVITPVIVTNSDEFGDIIGITGQSVKTGDNLIKVIR